MEKKGYASIAGELNQACILPPRPYWNNINHKENKVNSYCLWRDATVKNILKSDVYLGHMTQMTIGTMTYKNKTQVKKDKEDWVRIENSHEPIIDQQTWDAVQAIDLRKSTRQGKPAISLFSGRLRCKDCGANLGHSVDTQRRKNGTVVKYSSYACPTYRQTGHVTCSNHRIYEIGLIEIIKGDIRKQLEKIHCNEDAVTNSLKSSSAADCPNST